MRFLADGPSIPDDLLIDRDRGRVVFFCGAGVSQQNAGLPDFFGLAKQVMDALGAARNSPARRLVDEAKAITERTGIDGIVSADRVFGQLEKEFDVADVEAEVARALRSKENLDLTAHRIMLDLSKVQGGVRLVTTNFDRLFEQYDPSVCREDSRPPDPKKPEEFYGVIHLHGRVDEGYQKSDSGFVLSSASFGQAYLAEAWATHFIKAVVDNYIVVFVGYAADDPPVRYLLEALGRDAMPSGRLYAFQTGRIDEAAAKWRDRGVTAIPYHMPSDGDHHHLWETLDTWAERARDPVAWYKHVISLAQEGPETMSPCERGQVAHMVSYVDGSVHFAEAKTPPPAEWLCVFDPSIRCSKPSSMPSLKGQEERYSPSHAYGLDDDPEPMENTSKYPLGAWSCFALTDADCQSFGDFKSGHLLLERLPWLPLRLLALSHWIARVSNQPAAVWWAAGQPGIHPEIQTRIENELKWGHKEYSPEVRRAWRLIFEALQDGARRAHYDEWNDSELKRSGWTNETVREFSRITRPYLTVTRYRPRGRPPRNEQHTPFHELINLEVKYPEHEQTEIPDEYLVPVVREYRKNLEYAVSLENEDGWGLNHLNPINPDPMLNGQTFYDGANQYFKYYVELFQKLIKNSPDTARNEYLSWQADDPTAFAHLRIWIAGNGKVLSSAEAGRLISKLSDKVFWDGSHRPNLLLTLKERWNDFSVQVRKRLEKRLLRGRTRHRYEGVDEYNLLRAGLSLDRIHWLRNQGCKLDFDIDVETEKLRKLVPEWKPEYAATSAELKVNMGGQIISNTDYTALLSLTLEAPIEAARPTGILNEDFAETDPFLGLSKEKPICAFSWLIRTARKGDYPVWAWKAFFNAAVLRTDRSKFTLAIANGLSSIPESVMATFYEYVCGWFSNKHDDLSSGNIDAYDSLWTKLLKTYPFVPERSSPTNTGSRDETVWQRGADHSPVGTLAKVMMRDKRIAGLKEGQGFPFIWQHRAEVLLAMSGDSRRYVIFVFARSLNWFYWVNPSWTEERLLSLLEQDDNDGAAVRAGLHEDGAITRTDFFLHVKPHLLGQGSTGLQSPNGRRLAPALAQILTRGWWSPDADTGKRLMPSNELREILIEVDNEFRLKALLQMRVRLSARDAGWEDEIRSFFQEVWPRQKAVKTPEVSRTIADLAFTDEAVFSAVIDIILDLRLIVKTNRIFIHHGEEKMKIIEKHPMKVLALFVAILSEDARYWPSNFMDTLAAIEQADPDLASDSHLLDLKQRWNNRFR